MAASVLRADLERKKSELVAKYNVLVMNIKRLEDDKTSMNNEALMTKGAIKEIEILLSELDKEDEEISKAGKALEENNEQIDKK